MKYLKRFNESNNDTYNKELIELTKDLSLEYLDDWCVLNYYIMSLDGRKMFYGGQFSHGEDRFRKYCRIDSPQPFQYLIMVSGKPYEKTLGISRDDENISVTWNDENEELSNELVTRLKEIYPDENIVTKKVKI